MQLMLEYTNITSQLAEIGEAIFVCLFYAYKHVCGNKNTHWKFPGTIMHLKFLVMYMCASPAYYICLQS